MKDRAVPRGADQILLGLAVPERFLLIADEVIE
jgi:hypothetical protein